MMELNHQFLNHAIIALGCGAALLAYFGKHGLPAAILALVLAWSFPTPALGIGGALLCMFTILHVLELRTAEPEATSSQVLECEVVDAEFTVHEEAS